jgi:hypothetical protein
MKTNANVRLRVELHAFRSNKNSLAEQAKACSVFFRPAPFLRLSGLVCSLIGMLFFFHPDELIFSLRRVAFSIYMEKLYHNCRKTLPYMWKNFTTTVEKETATYEEIVSFG